MPTFQVVDGTQVNHDGTVYGPGERFEAEEDVAAGYVTAGWVKPVVDKGRRSK